MGNPYWRYFGLLMIVVLLALPACGRTPQAAPASPFPTPVSRTRSSPIPSSSNVHPTLSPVTTIPSVVSQEQCRWTWADGDAPAALREQAQQQFAATNLPGALVVRGYGEVNSCDHAFHAMGVDFDFTIQVADLHARQAMAAQATHVLPIPQQVSQGKATVGQVRIRFETANAYCWWQDTTQQCGPIEQQ